MIKPSIKLPEEIEHRLAELAVKNVPHKTFYVRGAILEHLMKWKRSIDLEDN